MSNVYALPLAAQPTAPFDPCYGLGHRMLTLEQICEWLSISERHVRKLVERDAIPYRKVGRLLRFPESEVEEWTRPAPRPTPLPSASTITRQLRNPPRPRSASHHRISMSSLYS